MKSEAWGCVTVSKKASAAPYSLRQLWNYWALENNTQGCQVLEVLSMTRFGPEAPSSIVVKYGVIGQNVCPFWLVFLCGGGRSSCSSCMGGELEVGQNVCPEWPVRPCGTTVE